VYGEEAALTSGGAQPLIPPPGHLLPQGGKEAEFHAILPPMSNVFDREARSRARGAVPGHAPPTRTLRKVSAESGALGAGAVGAGAVGTLGLGSLMVGAMAIGALAIGRLSVKRGRFERLHIGELTVDRLRLGRIEPLDHD